MKTVFTNGCFDLLHAGHVDFLRRSRELGEYLVVGLNSDESVRRLKGHRRPVISQAERRECLLAVRWVDEVHIFEEDTPQKLIEKIRPTVLVKGGDYEGVGVVGGDFVESYGGTVAILPLKAGISTSTIIARCERGRLL